MTSEGTKTSAGQDTRRVRRWRIAVTKGPSKGLTKQFSEGTVRIGSADTNEIVLADRKISRVHIEVEVLPTGLRVRDLKSKNGTFFQGSRVGTMELPIAGAVLTLGASEVAFQPDDPPIPLSASPREQCGRLLGRSIVIRGLFGQIERVALSGATVLIHGETGTGIEIVEPWPASTVTV